MHKPAQGTRQVLYSSDISNAANACLQWQILYIGPNGEIHGPQNNEYLHMFWEHNTKFPFYMLNHLVVIQF